MALGVVLKLLVTAVAGTAIVAPVSYFASSGAFSSSQSLTLENGEKCLYFPIKSGNPDQKLYVCKKKEDNTKPIFRWWTKGGAGEKGMQDIKTLSWNQKSQSTDITNNFELEVTLKVEDSGQRIIKEEGNYNYVTGAPIKNMETSCTFKNALSNEFDLLCQKADSVGEKGHEIQIYR